MANLQNGRQLQVAIFSDDFSPLEHGSAFEVARGLASEGAEVNVFSIRREGQPDFEAIDGVLVHRTSAINLTKALQVYGVVSPKLAPHSYSSLRDNPPDVIHAFGTTFCAMVAAGVTRVLGRPLVITLEAGVAESQPLRRRLPAFAYQQSVARAIVAAGDRIVCTNAGGLVQASRLGARSERTIVQPSAASDSLARQTIDVYVDVLAEREMRWFMQQQTA